MVNKNYGQAQLYCNGDEIKSAAPSSNIQVVQSLHITRQSVIIYEDLRQLAQGSIEGAQSKVIVSKTGNGKTQSSGGSVYLPQKENEYHFNLSYPSDNPLSIICEHIQSVSQHS